MQKLSLIGKNEQGKNSNQLLPKIECQTFWDKNTQQLAVIFDVQHSPIDYFYPNFHTYNALTLTRIMQVDFLWEDNCYELFLAFSAEKNSPYLEINFSPEGYFNLYHFDSYRTPQQIPPRQLQMTPKQRQQLINCYNVRQDWSAVFWQNSLSPHQAFRNLIEMNFPLETDSQRLVMMIDMDNLASLLKVENTANVWLNPCAVFNGEKEIAYFAHHHATPPDFHDKNYWLKSG